MKKNLLLITLLTIFGFSPLLGQVWFPEGLYTGDQPHLLRGDSSHLFLVSKAILQGEKTIWTIYQLRNKKWYTHSEIVVKNGDTITDIVMHNTVLYISGQFHIANDPFCIAKYENSRWQGVFTPNLNASLNACIYDLEPIEKGLIIAGEFLHQEVDLIQNIDLLKDGKSGSISKILTDLNPNGLVSQAKYNGNTIAIIGKFDSLLNQKCYGMAILDLNNSNNHLLSQLRTTYFLYLSHNHLGTIVAQNNKIYFVDSTLQSTHYNLDSAFRITSIANTSEQVVFSGLFKLSGSNTLSQIITFDNFNKWSDITNNFINIAELTTYNNKIYGFNRRKLTTDHTEFSTNYFINKFQPNKGILRVRVGVDINNDCKLKRSDDTMLANTPVFFEGGQISFTNENGVAHFLVDKTAKHTISTRVRPILSFKPCSDSIISYEFPSNKNIDTTQFILQKRANVRSANFSINSIQGGRITPRKTATYHLKCENTGSIPLSGFLYLKKVKELDILNTIPVAQTINDTLIRWRITDLINGEIKQFYIQGDPNFEEGSQDNILTETYLVLDQSNLEFSGNDRDFIYQATYGSDNAFQKFVSPSSNVIDSIAFVELGKEIRFDILLDNYSNDTVNYIVITDTLDLNLNISEIIETGSNKSYKTRVFTDPNQQNKGIIVWTFEDAKLWPNPQKAGDNQNSRVTIGFRIKLKENSLGQTISNSAQVAIEHQYSGETNTVYCEVVEALAGSHIINYLNNHIKIFPNPAKSKFTIQSELKIKNI